MIRNMAYYHKQKLLLDFLDKYRYLPAQGSEEWLAQRLESIGGSEMGTVCGVNKYSKVKTLISQRLGLTKRFSGNVWTRMGNLYENITAMYMEYCLKARIHETGSIPGLRDPQGKVIQAFSPDGLTVASAFELDNIIPPQFKHGPLEEFLIDAKANNPWLITLLEFKAPGRRIPANNWTEATRSYEYQVLTGLDTVKITEIGIYVDAIIRRCSIYDIGANPRCYKEPTEPPRNDLKTPAVCGFIGVYEVDDEWLPPEEASVHPHQNVFEQYWLHKPAPESAKKWAVDLLAALESVPVPDNNKTPIDFGSCSQYQFEDMLLKTISPRPDWKLYYSQLYDPHTLMGIDGDPEQHFQEELNDFMDRDDKVIGYIPYKLYYTKIIPIMKQPGFVEAQRDLIMMPIDVIRQLKHLPPEEKRARYEEMFPPRRRRKNKTSVPVKLMADLGI